MRFGQKLKELRKARNLSQRELASRVSLNFTYLSKIENERLDFGEAPSDEAIHKLAQALDADVDELLLLARKIPDRIKERVIQRPDAFRKFASMTDDELNKLLEQLDEHEE